MSLIDDFRKKIGKEEEDKKKSPYLKEPEQKIVSRNPKPTNLFDTYRSLADDMARAEESERNYLSNMPQSDQSAYKRAKESNWVYSSPYLKKGREGKSDLEYNFTPWNSLSKEEKEWWFDQVEAQPDADYTSKNTPWQARYAYDILNASQMSHGVTNRLGSKIYEKEPMFDLQAEQRWMWNSLPAEVRNGIRSNDKKALEYLNQNYSPDEVSMFKKYAEFAADLEDVNALKETQEEMMAEHPLYAIIGAPLQQMGADIGASVISAPRTLYNAATNRGNYDVVNPYDSFMQKAAEAGRGVQQSILEGLEEQKFWQNYYQNSVSAAESAMRLALARGVASVPGKAAQRLGTTFTKVPFDKLASLTMNGMMFSSVAQNSLVQQIQKGVPAEQALSKAIAEGAFECIFETVSFDKLGFFQETPIVGSPKQFAANLLKSGFVEGSEEVATDIANELYDYYMMYDFSDFKAFKDKLEAERGTTLTDREAWAEYRSEFADKLLQSFKGGAFSGIAMGGAANKAGIENYQKYESMGLNVSDAMAARMSPIVTSMWDNPNIFAMYESANGDETVWRGMMQEIYDDLSESYGKQIESATKKNLPTIMQNINTALNGALNENLINKYNAKMVEFGQEDGQVDYAKFKQNVEKGNITTFDDLAYGTGDSKTLQNYEAAYGKFRDAATNPELGDKYRYENMINASDAMEKSAETARKIVENAALRGESLDSPSIRKYVNILGLEDSARAYSTAKAVQESKALKTRNGVVTKLEADEANEIFGDNSKYIIPAEQKEIANVPEYQSAYRLGQVIAKMTGANVKLYKSMRVGVQNGAFSRERNTIYIDVAAGESGQTGAIGEAFSHELTHWMRANNEAGYQNLLAFVRSNENFDKLVEDRINQSKKMAEKNRGRVLSEDEAQEEIVAQACQRMLSSSETFLKYAAADAKGARTFVERFKDFIKRLRDAFKGSLNNEATRMISDLEGLQQTWETALQEAIGEQTAMEGGIDVETFDDTAVRDSIRTVLDEKQQERVSKMLQDKLGVDKKTADEYIENEQSIASLIFDNIGFLDYKPDDRYEAIKKNSDYPQGTVDMTNLCRKRAIFTQIFDSLQEHFPNRLFNAMDIADIREVLKTNGYQVACALCFVEDRRQRVGEIAENFIERLKESNGKTLTVVNSKGETKELFMTKDLANTDVARRAGFKYKDAIKVTDKYIPNQYDLVTYEGFKALSENHPQVAVAFTRANNYLGMSSARLVEGRAEYKRDILKYTPTQVKRINNKGGLRIFSFSDFEAVHLLDICQVIMDASAVGLKIQAYTKVPAFAKLVANTGIKLNRSLIASGKGFKVNPDGSRTLTYDTHEGIDINDRDFFDSSDNPNIGNILAGISDEHIRLAMLDDFVDYIIPFHSNQGKNVLAVKGISHWTNYKEYQRERYADGRKGARDVNIYTQVIDKYHPTNKVEFVEAFLKECKSQGKIPRFDQFLNKVNGEYVYTPGYEKLLLDFKLFDKQGNILPQNTVNPNIDMEVATRILNDEVKGAEKREQVSGKIIKELEKKYEARNSSRDSERDSEYMAAVNSGDVETAQRLVDEAAKEAGYTNHLYHGTDAFGFTVIDYNAPGADGYSFWASDREDTAGTYTQNNALRKIEKKVETFGEEQEKALEDVERRIREGVDHFRDLIDEYIDEWYFGQDYDAHKYLVKEIEKANHEAGYGDGVYDLLDEVVWAAYDGNEGRFLDEYSDFDDWKDNSEEAKEIYDTIVDLETLRYSQWELGAKGIKGGIYDLYANTDNLFEYDAHGNLWNDLDPTEEMNQVTTMKTRDVADWARENGYDGVHFKNIRDNGKYGRTAASDVYAFFHPQRQVKSADPVTYDDNGNVIPLSERFNKKSEDIRYSPRETVISIGMSDEERTEILKDKVISVKEYNGEAFEKLEKYKNDIESLKHGLVTETLDRIASELHLYDKSLYNDEYQVEIEVNSNTFDESLNQGIKDAKRIVKMMPFLDIAVKNAVGLKVENNQYFAETNGDKYIHLIGGYIDGDLFIPVRFGLKLQKNHQNLLHVVVDTEGIDKSIITIGESEEKNKDKVVGKDSQSKETGISSPRLSNISIPLLLKNVNSPILLRYIPDSFVTTEEKMGAKHDAIKKAQERTDRRNNKNYYDFLHKKENSPNKRAAKDMLKREAAAFGFTVKNDVAFYDNESSIVRDLQAIVDGREMVGVPFTDIFKLTPEEQKKVDETNNGEKELFSTRDSEGRELSEGQQDYFADSKVRDENGNLQVVYHGTDAGEFYVFEPSEWVDEVSGKTRVKGYFSESKDYATAYGETVPYYLNIKNPLNAMDRWAMTLNEWEKWFASKGIKGVKFDTSIEKDTVKGGKFETGTEYSFYEIIDNMGYYWNGDGNVTEKIEEAGYDGICWDENGTCWVPFNRNAIKRTDNLNPTESDDIRFSYRDLANSESEILVNMLKYNEQTGFENLPTQALQAYAKAYNELKEMEKQTIEYSKQLSKKGTTPSEREAILRKQVRLDRAILNKTTELTEMRNQRVIRDLLIDEWEKRDEMIAIGRAEERYQTRKVLEEKYGKELAELRAKSKQKQQDIRDRHTINERKAHIIKKTKQLMDMCLHPTEKKKVPTILINPVMEMLDAIDYWTPKEGRPVTKKSESLRERFLNFKEAINNYQKQIDEGTAQIEYMFDPEFLETIDDLVESVKGIENVNDMSAQAITDLDQTLTQMYHLINRGNKMITAAHYATVNEFVDKTQQAMDKRKTLSKKTSAKGNWLQRLNAGMSDTYAFGEYAGEGTRDIVDMLSKAFENKESHVKEAIEFTQNVLKPYQKDLKKWSNETHDFTLSTEDKDGNPNKVSLTVGQMMELYLLNKREQARGHIYGGGIKVEDRKGRYTESVRITEQDVADIIRYLESVPGAIEVANALQQYGATTVTGWGNQASNLMYGISKFTDENYWQIRSDSSALKDNENTEKALNASMYRLQNLGRTKAVKKGANNAIYIGDVFDTWSKTIDEMTSYASILPATTDAMRWWNSRVTEGEDSVRVKKLLESKLGTDMTKVFTDSIKALNGGIMGTDSLESLVKNLTGKAKAAAVAGNLRVVLQQPTAYTRAAAVIDPKYLLRALLMKPAANEAQEHSAIAWHKAQGFYSNGLAPSLRKLVIGDASFGENLTEKSLWLAGKADDITWGALWNASKLKVEAENKALRKGSDAYWDEVNKVFSDIINQTQVVDTPLTKSTWMRGNGLGVFFTAFMAEPTKTYSMVMERMDKVLQNPTSKTAWKAFGGVATVFAVNALVNAMAQALADAARDDDKEKDYWEKYIEKYKEDAKDNLNPITYIPVVKDIFSMWKGYSNNNLAMQAAQNSVYALQEIDKIRNGKSKKTLFGQAETIAKAVSSWTGIPVGNVMRTLNSIGNVAGVDIFRRKKYTNAELGRNIALATNEGNYEEAEEYMDELLKNVGGDEKKANNYLIDYLAENDNDIDAWAQQYIDDPTVLDDAIYALSDKYSADIVTAAIRKSAKDDGADVGSKALANGNTVYTSNDLNRMLEKGDIAKAQEIIDDINAAYSQAGSKTTAKDAVTRYWKPKYLAASGAERDRILRMLYSLKNNGKQMYSAKDIQKWK